MFLCDNICTFAVSMVLLFHAPLRGHFLTIPLAATLYTEPWLQLVSKKHAKYIAPGTNGFPQLLIYGYLPDETDYPG